MSKEAMKLALEALEKSIDVPCYGGHPIQEAAAVALREALAEPDFWEGYVPEPTMYLESGGLGYGPAPERKLIIGYVNKSEQPVKPATEQSSAVQPAQQDSTCSNALRAQGKAYPRTCNKCGLGPCIADRVQPAQQELLTDIYRSFEQWKSGNVLEHGVPRTEHYSEAQLDLVEMGWNYGYDAGRAVEQALDKKAENARELGLDYEPEQEPVAIEHCIWARNGNTPCPHTSPPQRTWVGLTDEEIDDIYQGVGKNDLMLVREVEAKLRSKNEDRN